MKKIFALILAVSFCFLIPCFAESEITVSVNGKVLVTDVPPTIIEGRTLVPMRAVFESLGADVNWIAANNMIIATAGSKIMSMVIGSDVLAIQDVQSGEYTKVTLDVPPTIIDSRTLVPVRAISEALGADVAWDGETRTVTVKK